MFDRRIIFGRVCAFACLAAAYFLGQNAMAQNIFINLDGKSYEVALYENDAARDFIKNLPMTLVFENFGSTERIAYLKKSLATGSAPDSTEPVTGDITYYKPWGNIAVFVQDFRFSEDLVPLGRLTPEALNAIANSGKKPVTFSLKP